MATLVAVVGASCAMVSSVVAQPLDLHPTWQRTIPHSGYGARLDVRDGVGTLVTTPDLLVAHAQDGTPRWQVDACTSSCAPSGSTGHTTWDHGVLRADGGAWAVRKVRTEPFHGVYRRVSVVRIDAAGIVRDEYPLLESSYRSSLAIAAPGNGLVVLVDDRVPGSTHVAFASFDGSGVRTGDARLTTWEFADVQLSMRLLPGGDIVVAVREMVLCFLGCEEPRSALLRLRPTGAVVWRQDFDDPYAEAVLSLEADGSASGFVHSWAGVERRFVGADGVVRIGGSVPAFVRAAIYVVSPSIGGRQLVEYLEREPEIFTGIALLDRRGTLVAPRSFHSSGWINPTPTAFGFIGDDGFGEADAELMSASTLETLARFHLDTPGAAEPWTRNTWHVLENGIVYGFGEVTEDSGARHFALARFDLVATGASSCTRDPRPQDGPVAASPRATASSVDGCAPRRPIRLHAAPQAGSPVR
ncbi:hypothetical protein ACQQ2N_07640 [Dokdonella sp. MW10]|uniref:hypothetical protein n=1 Tax=Dokdonella sp. MW10 TaxID=2992926 RepID=UPI003F7F2222